MKPGRHNAYGTGVHGKVGSSTVKQLVRVQGTVGHLPRFDKILPGTMDKLVAKGLFEPWEGTYRITALGKKVLKQLELEEGIS